MPALRKKKSVGSHVPTTSMNTRNTTVSSINVVPTRRATESQLPTASMSTRGTPTLPAVERLSLPASSARTRNMAAQPFPPSPFNHTVPRTPTLPNRYPTGIPLSANVIPSDTTEWDPNMVSPAKMDPAYKPTAPAAMHIHNLRSGWGSSSPAHPNKQTPAPHQNGGHSSGAFWTTVGVPEIGMFPTVPPGSNSQMTQLHPIPLDFSRVAGPETPARPTSTCHAGAVLGRGSSPLGRDIPPPLFAMAPVPMRRTTRSSTFVHPPLPSLEQPVQALMGTALTPAHQHGQLVDSQDSVAQETPITETEAQDQQRKLRKTRIIRERHQAGAMERKEHRQGTMGAAGQSSPSVQYMAASNSPSKLPGPKSPVRIPASVQAAIDQIPRYLGQIAENPQVVVDPGPACLERITVSPHATAGHPPKYLQRVALPPQSPKHPEQVIVNLPTAVTQPTLAQKNTSINDPNPGSPIQSSLATVGQIGSSQIEPGRGMGNLTDTNRNSLVAASKIPRYLGQAAVDPRTVVNNNNTRNPEHGVRDPLVPINHPVPVTKSTDSISWMTPERPSSLPRPALPFPIPQDPSNPSFGTTRPGTESPNYFDDVDSSWVFMQSRQPPAVEGPPTVYGSTPELETLLTSPTEDEDVIMLDAESKDERISGSTPTSYSQCPGSPTSLINMYRVHGDLDFIKRRGLSLLHTKRIYIGEKVLLDLDMPAWGDDYIMGVEEMERLMDEMIGGEPGAEIKLASVNKDRETGGRCLDCMSYVEWR